MAKNGNLIGSAGTYHLASSLNFSGWHAAITTGNAPDIDLIATIEDRAVSIQVKTAGSATRKNELQWGFDVSKAERLEGRGIWLVLVDLHGFSKLPDFYVTPPELVARYYR